MTWTIEPSNIPGLYDVYDEDGNRVVRHTTQERAALIAAAPAMQKALEFYADSASWKRKRATGGWPIAESQSAAKDRGKRARAALGQDK